jgi:ATP-dependent DNA ligase
MPILDGELACLGADGRSQFFELMRRRRQDVIFYAFDLLRHDGEDLRQLPLVERKRRLRRLIRGHTGLLCAEYVWSREATRPYFLGVESAVL